VKSPLQEWIDNAGGSGPSGCCLRATALVLLVNRFFTPCPFGLLLNVSCALAAREPTLRCLLSLTCSAAVDPILLC
jgi:hypothetical protein